VRERGADRTEESSGGPVIRRGLIEVRLGGGLGIGRVEEGRLIEGEPGLGRSAGGSEGPLHAPPLSDASDDDGGRFPPRVLGPAGRAHRCDPRVAMIR
jgi:hypothetical protein